MAAFSRRIAIRRPVRSAGIPTSVLGILLRGRLGRAPKSAPLVNYVDALPEMVVMLLTISTITMPTSAPTRQ